MSLPKGNQIAAARALLGWDQKDVAEKVQLSVAAISKIEKGENKGKIETLERIERVFSDAGIEFIENEGVKKKSGDVTVYRGHEGFTQFRYDVLESARAGHLDICVSNVDERDFAKWGAAEMNAAYRAAIAEIPDVRFRILIKEGDDFFSARNYAEYRHVSLKDFGDIPFYVYGDKTAIFSFDLNDLHIFIIQHPAIARFYRMQFDMNWQKAKPAVIK